MLSINTFVDSWRDVQTTLPESVKNLTLNPLGFIKREFGKYQSENLIYSTSAKRHLEIKTISSDQDCVLKNVNIDETISSLKRDGFSLELNLPRHVTQQIWQFAMQAPCYGNSDAKLGFYYPENEQAQAKHGKPFVSASYYNTALLCPIIKKLESEPTLLEIAATYLNAEPVHQGNQLWWSFPVESSIYERRRAAQMFHRDLNGSRCLKFSFYITDVDLCSSPHVCVRGSHLKKKRSHVHLLRECSYQKITEYYGYESIVPICGKADSGFVEDTLCFHKGTAPSSKDRLTLQIEFAARDSRRQNDLTDASKLELIS